MAKTEDRARDPQAAVLDLLSDFKGLDPVKELFWKELNYERINEPISRRGWTENAAKSLTDDPIVFAGGGENNISRSFSRDSIPIMCGSDCNGL